MKENKDYGGQDTYRGMPLLFADVARLITMVVSGASAILRAMPAADCPDGTQERGNSSTSWHEHVEYTCMAMGGTGTNLLERSDELGAERGVVQGHRRGSKDAAHGEVLQGGQAEEAVPLQQHVQELA